MGRVWRTARREDEAGLGDDRLIDGLRRGAPSAFAGLHEQYAAGIYSLALRMVRHAPDAEDITQDVLLRAFERVPKDREVLLRPWLYRLTLNRCYDYFRVSARRPLAAPTDDVVSPHDPYEQSELQGLLEATIGDLTRRQQAALLLKDVHGLSLVEVAACLELTPGSVEVLLARARRAFRARYEVRCAASGRSLPRSAVGVTALPLLPLPPGLAAPVVPVMPPAHLPVPVFTPPLTLAAGSGIGAVLGLPASLKAAVLIAAAAATMGTAEIAVTHADQRPAGRMPAAARVAAAGPATKAPATQRDAGPSVPASHPVPTSSPSAKAQPSSSPSPTEVADPSPVASPLGNVTPSATPEPSTTPTPVDTPTGQPTASPSPSPSPTLYASPSASPSPEPSPSPTI